MSGRDRVIGMVIAVLVVIAAGWVLLVSPERKKADKLNGEVSTAQSAVSTAEGELTSAQAARSKYADAYAAVVHLGKAVPPAQEVASLMYQMASVTTDKHIGFESIQSGSGASASSAGTTTPAAALAGFTTMPFTFEFSGDYFDLEHLFSGLTGFANHEVSGGLQIDGRLLTIQSVKLAGSATPASQSGGKAISKLSGSVTASAYVLPAETGLTAGATPAAPAGATPATTAPSSTGTGTPAVSKVLP